MDEVYLMIPHLLCAYCFCFSGNLANEDEVLGWLIHQKKSEEIEDVTDEMLNRLVDKHEHVAVVVCE